MWTSMPRARRTPTRTARPTVVGLCLTVVNLTLRNVITWSMLTALAPLVTHARMAMAFTQLSHILSRERGPGSRRAAAPCATRLQGAAAEEDSATRSGRIMMGMILRMGA